MGTLTPVGIVTDSAAGLPLELIQQYRIAVIPFWVMVGGISYRDGIDIHPPQLFKLLREQVKPDAATGVPSVEVFLETYRRVAEWAKSIVSIHLTAVHSAAYRTAEAAATRSDVPVVVVNTGSTAMGEGFVVLEAARAASRGLGLQEVARVASEVASRVGLLALLESIDYAVRGGRLASAARLMGSLLRIQGLVRVQADRVSLVGQARRRRRGRELLVEKIAEMAGTSPVHVAVHYSDNEAEGHRVLTMLKARVKCVEEHLLYVPAALGVHAGPGSIGVGFYVEGEGELLPSLRRRIGRLTAQAREVVSEAKNRLPRIER